MKKLYHYPLCPLSRQIRICLKELNVSFSMIKEDYWQRHGEFLKINPAGTLPVLEESSGFVVSGIYPVIEYLHEKYPTFNLMDEDIDVRAEIRRLLIWFNEKFYREVTKVLIDEKVVRLMMHLGGPRTDFLRVAKSNLGNHLNYINKLLEKRGFIASDTLSVADIAASAHLSVVDYFGEINWDKWPQIREWYAILKSRPSFRPVLQDQIAGFIPPVNYSNLDF